MEKKNLSKEFRKTMEEVKAWGLTTAMSASTSTMDEEDIMENVKALRLMNRLLDLSCEMFEKRDKLMDKVYRYLDKMDEYLEE